MDRAATDDDWERAIEAMLILANEAKRGSSSATPPIFRELRMGE
jgi:hypothetical protein